jgi:hypothetical protein
MLVHHPVECLVSKALGGDTTAVRGPSKASMDDFIRKADLIECDDLLTRMIGDQNVDIHYQSARPRPKV